MSEKSEKKREEKKSLSAEEEACFASCLGSSLVVTLGREEALEEARPPPREGRPPLKCKYSSIGLRYQSSWYVAGYIN